MCDNSTEKLWFKKGFQIIPNHANYIWIIWNDFKINLNDGPTSEFDYEPPIIGGAFWDVKICVLEPTGSTSYRALAVSSRVAAGLPLKKEGHENCRRDKENILACQCRNGNPSETTCSMLESTSSAAIPRIPPTLPSGTISAAIAMPVGSVTDLGWCTKIARCTALDDAKESLKDLKLGTYTYLTSLMYVTEKSEIVCKM